MRKIATGACGLLLFTVVLPTSVAAWYFGAVASDVFVSESLFVVRSPQRTSSPSGLGALLQGTGFAGFARSAEDVRVVHDYITSRDALGLLERMLSLKASFANPAIDRLSRFTGIDPDDSFEALYKYYRNHVELSLDTESSISTLTVRAFSAEQAQTINKVLLTAAERLVNQLNERGRHDLVGFAQSEVERAEARARDAALALSRFRGAKAVMDPERQSALQLQQITKMQDEVIATKTQLAQLRAFTPQNPQIPALEVRIKTLQGEIASEMAKVTGTDSLSSKVVEYERLSIEREFADKQLALAMSSLEQARAEAQRKQLYLERIAQPNRPDTAIEPRRVRSIAAVFALSLIVAGVLSILLSGIREHRD